MWTGAVRLAVDIGACHAAAVVRLADGHRVVLTPDGMPVMPSGVFVDPDTGRLIVGGAGLAAAVTRPDCYVSDVKGRLADTAVTVAGRSVEPVDLVAAVLRPLADEAARAAGQPPHAVTLTVPADWGPRRRALLRAAAARAVLPDPDLLAEPVAVVEHLAAVTGNAPPAGACVLVCDAGATALRLTVLQIEPATTTMLATRSLPEGGGDTIDAALAEHAWSTLGAAAWHRLAESTNLDDVRTRRALVDAARHAKHTLWHTERTIIALPPPHLPVVVDRATLAAATESIRHRLPEAIKEIVEAADVASGHLYAVVLTGGGAVLPGLADELTTAVGMAPVIPARTDLGAADGAAAHGNTVSVPLAAEVQLPRVRLRIRHLAAPLALGTASLAALTQMLTTADVQENYVRTTSVRAATELVGVAGLLAMLAAYAIAYLVPTTWLSGPANDNATTGALIRNGHTIAAALGLAVAGIHGLFAGAYYGLADPTYVRWALLSAAPVAVAALVIGLAGPRIPSDHVSAWLSAGRIPLPGILLGAVGTLLMHFAHSVSPSHVPISTGIISMLGGAAIGVGIALTVTRQRIVRIITTPVLGLGIAVSASLGNAPIITTAYIYAAAWWALTITVHTVRSLAQQFRVTHRGGGTRE